MKKYVTLFTFQHFVNLLKPSIIYILGWWCYLETLWASGRMLFFRVNTHRAKRKSNLEPPLFPANSSVLCVNPTFWSSLRNLGEGSVSQKQYWFYFCPQNLLNTQIQAHAFLLSSSFILFICNVISCIIQV